VLRAIAGRHFPGADGDIAAMADHVTQVGLRPTPAAFLDAVRAVQRLGPNAKRREDVVHLAFREARAAADQSDP
jgi:hypothetical protein